MQSVSIVQIQDVTYEKLLKDLYALNSQSHELHQPKKDDEELLTRADVCELFGVSLPTVHSWDNAGILKKYKIGTRTYFKRSEVMKSLRPVIDNQ